ncbi:MAG TPA: cation:proton antiporter [Sphingobacterium sp.]|nr:cation:proton antiporter [Sphingobacterium sp.]
MDNRFFDNIQHAFETPLTNSVLIFTLVLSIILLSPILLKWVKLPGIIGFIISGVIIGPYGLNWLEANSAVDLFSTIGLLYIMFIAGLELDMNEFKKSKHKSLIFGILTFVIPFSVGFPVSHFLLGYSVLSSLLISSMFATHTLVSYPIVTSYGISKNEAVAITIGGTILTDTAVLLILTGIVGASEGTLDSEFWITLGVSFAIFLLIMIGMIPKIAKWFFQKIEGEKTSHYIFVLAVVFFAAFLAELAGLESIIGAFVAGLALNKLIPASSALMNRIEFIGNSIFIPFFLISVGMIVDVQVLFQGPLALIIAGSLTIAATLGKYVAAFFTQKVFKYSVSQRNLIFGLSSAHAAATLAVIKVGFDRHIIDENVLNGTIVLILVSCIVSTLVTESASKTVVMEGEQDSGYAKVVEEKDEVIMIPIANLKSMEPLLDYAGLIKSKKSPYPLHILTVVPNNQEAEKNLLSARENLDKTAKYASGSETSVELMATVDINIANGISRASEKILADCILLGWPSASSFIEKIVGEKTESILNRTHTNLMMCRLEKPAISQTSIDIFVPPMAEAELGFDYWMDKMLNYAIEMSLPIKYIANDRTHEAIEAFLKRLNSSVPVSYEEYNDWNNIFGLDKLASDKSLLVFVSARSGTLSYRDSLHGLARKIEGTYREQNIILIFPSRVESYSIDDYETVESSPIFRKISREIGNMFHS